MGVTNADPDPHAAEGDAPCWAHLVEDAPGLPVDLGALLAGELGSDVDGAVWSLPHGGDLDANLVRLGAGGAIAEHVNDDVDVLLVVHAGGGELIVDELRHPLRAGQLALVPRGARRSLRAGTDGIGYLSIHRRRSPMTIKRR